MFRFIVFASALVLCLSAHAQPDYPKNYFRNPLNIPINLAGNFGECRPNHFHSGIDIKTEGKENFAVLAAADGYVSRIKMEAGGFGHALYITHPNGYTTLYAHLNDFAPAIQKVMVQEQYATKSWTVDFNLPPNQLPVKKGALIARSGNTGGSTAPHLHFEIRDTKTEHPLNPQLFGFDIKDNVAPKLLKLYVYNGARSIQMQKPLTLPLQMQNGVYRTANDTVKVMTSKAGIALHLFDYMDGSNNSLAYYTMEWYANEVLQGKITLDDIGYDVTRYLYAYCDHATMQRSNEWPILLFMQPGNKLQHLYTSLNDDQGKINVQKAPVPVRIVVKDTYGNKSEISFVLASNGADNFVACNNEFTGKNTLFEQPNCKAVFQKGTFYDTVCITYQQTVQSAAYSKKHRLLNAEVPSQFYFDLSIKADKAVPFEQRNRIVMKYDDGKKESAKAAEFKDGWYVAQQRNFGSYWLAIDTIAPSITALQKPNAVMKNGSILKFSVQDKTTSVASFQVYAGNQWLCFEQRGNVWQYKIDEHCPKGKVTLKATAKDENGNLAQSTFSFHNQ